MKARHETLIDMLAARARDGRGELRFVAGSGDVARISYRDLASQAASLAAGLHARGLKPGDLLGVVLRSDLDFVRVFLAAVAAGIVPVPLYPPTSLKRFDHYLANLRAIFDTLPLAGLVALPEVAGVLELAWRGGSRRLPVWTAATIGAGSATYHPAAGDDLAFLQCTSGSTGVPKPVQISHANVTQNLEGLAARAGDCETDTVCSWLPMFHDMGLLSLLRPLYFDYPLVLMEPQTFLGKPIRWLRAISDHRATITASPNFAFDLCVRKTTPDERVGLDLSPWRLAYNGAEPIRASVVAAFLDTFEAHGFRRASMYPCYGMSESTLAATLPAVGATILGERFRARDLEAGRAVVAGADADADVRVLVGLGAALPGHDVRVVDPASGEPRDEGQLGQVVVAGPSVSSGYWGRPDRTAEAFGSWVRGDAGRWLRTSDQGFFHRGQLFVLGRLDDVLNVRGRKLHPHEVEAAVEDLPGVRRGCVAAIQLRAAEGISGPVVVVEAAGQGEDPRRFEDRVRRGVLTALGVEVERVVRIAPGCLPKTSSGKICRAATREALLRDALPISERSGRWRELQTRLRLAWSATVNRLRG